MRKDGRKVRELRDITLELGVNKFAEGSVMISFGDTKVLCTATIEEKVPPFLRGEGTGWISAEYSMLPRATHERNRRESAKGKLSGRTMEIQRLIGRALRSVVDLEKLGERSILLDCDVLQADGGTRTASITGAFVAMSLAVRKLMQEGCLTENPIREALAAVSVGMLSNGECVVDLDYQEDSQAKVDMNLVMTESGQFVEIQGTGEESTFSSDELHTMLTYGKDAIQELIGIQKDVLPQADIQQSKKPFAEKNLVVATRNPGKAKEFKQLFEPLGFTIKTLLDFPEIADVEETGTTFEANARLKAETIAQTLQCFVLADDSGLEVDALDGMPGVYSARFAGEHKSDAANNAKLLHEMTDVPPEKRGGNFHCTLVLASPDRASLVAEGNLKGEITRIPRGDNGFGYDPLFYLPEYGKTLAELSDQEKNQISHRRRAIEALQTKLEGWLEKGDEADEVFGD